MADTHDPFFIVPAVVPDDAPVSRPTTGEMPRTEILTRQTTSPVTRTTPTPAAALDEPVRRSVTFERPAVRRTTRVLRHVDPWSVFRVALVFHFVLYLTLLLTGVLLWNVANATGTVDNVERFLESFGWDTFQFNGGELFHQAWVLGLFVVIGLTGLAILAVTTFNLITDLVGGVHVTILESKQKGLEGKPKGVEGRPEGKKTPKSPSRTRQSQTSRVDRQ